MQEKKKKKSKTKLTELIMMVLLLKTIRTISIQVGLPCAISLCSDFVVAVMLIRSAIASIWLCCGRFEAVAAAVVVVVVVSVDVNVKIDDVVFFLRPGTVVRSSSL